MGGCAKDEPAVAQTQPTEAPPAAAPAAAPVPAPAAPPPAAAETTAPEPLQATGQQWSPEAMEELLAPIALYPDAVLYQVLISSTNPQEVLDAGNWLIANPDLSGKPLDEAAEAAGFTPPIRALIQFPQVVDNMCLNMDWTEELGQAYVNDQPGVQDAVQRLRKQAESVGNLESSEYMTVSNETQDGQQTIIIQPAEPQVIYVPQYDPNVAYSSQPASTATNTTAAPAATTTTEQDEGYSGGQLIATGLLAFGAGMVVNEVFNDDDDDWYNNNYGWGAPYPYYPPYPYRPNYGGGHYPHHNYNRPNNYVRGGNTVIVNQNNNYYNRFDRKGGYNKRAPARSPITAANPNRTDLARAKSPSRQARPANRPAVQGTYAGAKPGASGRKIQGNYAGANRSAAKRSTPAASRPASSPARSAKVDRGYNRAAASPASRNTGGAKQTGTHKKTAFSGARGGKDPRAASQRGRKSGSGKDLKARHRDRRR
jgi:hypothetical protein